MPIPAGEWKGLITGSLLRLSDREYQRLAWFGKHPEQTSPAAQIRQLLDDYSFRSQIRPKRLSRLKFPDHLRARIIFAALTCDSWTLN